jgi:hypothetical protein
MKKRQRTGHDKSRAGMRRDNNENESEYGIRGKWGKRLRRR